MHTKSGRRDFLRTSALGVAALTVPSQLSATNMPTLQPLSQDQLGTAKSKTYNLAEKINLLENCLTNNLHTNAIGHVLDLFAHVIDKLPSHITLYSDKGWNKSCIEKLVNRYGENPSIIIDEVTPETEVLKKHNSSGHPTLTVIDKTSALEYCIANRLYEDAIGHICDLLAHSISRLQKLGAFEDKQWSSEFVAKMAKLHGSPAQVI